VRNFAICGRTIPALHAHNASIQSVSINGVPILCGVLETADRAFDARLPANAHHVLVRVHRFSCNYRDKSFVMVAAAHLPNDKFYVIGSEFVGDVVAAGRSVQRVQVGDRVIGDNTYPHRGPGYATTGAHAGIPTNNASGEYLILHEDKVIAIPPSMDDDVAAAFSLGAQTAFSMVEKLALHGGEHVLVTAAKSNTSLFAIEALRERGVHVYATTTSGRHADELRARGVRQVFVVDAARQFVEHEELLDTARACGGFHGVVDPFIDLHLHKVLPVMRDGGRYVTCGMHDQRGLTPLAPTTDYYALLVSAIVRNITIIGNCVGLRPDLDRALAVYARGDMRVAVDSVFRGDQAGAFLQRTFDAPDRFGKVVYAYQ